MLFNNIPQELKINGLWCCWRLTDKGKLPFDVLTGNLARSNDKTTFHAYQTVMENLNKYLSYDEEGKQTGGIGLGVFNGFSAIDIDKCRNDVTGELSELAKEIIEHCSSYTEISPSGKGIRIIFKTDTELNKDIYYINNHDIGLEIYLSNQTNKYVTITGDVIAPNKISFVDLKSILNKYMLKNKKKTPIESWLKKDKKLKQLWEKKAPGKGEDESETDLALCSKLSYYLGKNIDIINQYFISSPYFESKDIEHKNKWLVREDYKLATLEKAITNEILEKHIDATFDLTDTGNAHKFVERFGDKIRYNVDDKNWYIWNGKFWQNDYFNNIKNMAEAMAEELRFSSQILDNANDRNEMLKNVKRILSSSGKEAMLKEAMHLPDIPLMNSMLDYDNHLLNTESGVVNLKTGEIFTHDKNLLISNISPYEIDRQPPKRWLQFLDEIFASQKDIIPYIQKMFGYCLTGFTLEQCIFFLVGDGNNGKSLFHEILLMLLGDYGTTSKPEILLEKPISAGNTASPEIAKLVGKRLSVVSETNVGSKLNESAVKTFTSGIEKIVARRLYGNEFEFKPKFKLMMATNNKPIIRGTDLGIWRRIRVIMFEETFLEDKDDKTLITKLTKELPSILWWAIQGAMLWFQEGLKSPKKLVENVKEYRSEMDLIQRWLNECCDIGFSFREKALDLFSNFCNYISTNREYQMSNTAFGRNMSKKFNKNVINGATYYHGVKLKKNNLYKIDRGKYDDL